MKTRKAKGLYDQEDTVYTIESMDDWDEYERLNGSLSDFAVVLKKCFSNYLGKTWQDVSNIRYTLNGKHVYAKYEIIGIENNKPLCDWYWILKSMDGDKKLKYALANDAGFKKNIIDL